MYLGYGIKNGVKYAMVKYYVLCNLANCHAGDWWDGNYVRILYPDANLSSQRISDMLLSIGDEGVSRDFFKEYVKLLARREEGTDILIDSTHGPARQHPFPPYGHQNISNEMRLISILQQETELPLFMRYCPASVIDVTTLTKTILELKANGIRTKFAILDSGFYSLSDAPQVQLSFQLSPFYTPANATSFFESFSATDLYRRSSDLQQQTARSALYAAKAKVEQTYDAAAQVRAMQQDIVTYRMNLILQLREYENKQVVLETEQIRFGAGISDASRLRQKELGAMQAAFTALGTLVSVCTDAALRTALVASCVAHSCFDTSLHRQGRRFFSSRCLLPCC